MGAGPVRPREAALANGDARQGRMAGVDAGVDQADPAAAALGRRSRAARKQRRGRRGRPGQCSGQCSGRGVVVVEFVDPVRVEGAEPIEGPSQRQAARRGQHHHGEVQPLQTRLAQHGEAGVQGGAAAGRGGVDRDDLGPHYRPAQRIGLEGAVRAPDQVAQPGRRLQRSVEAAAQTVLQPVGVGRQAIRQAARQAGQAGQADLGAGGRCGRHHRQPREGGRRENAYGHRLAPFGQLIKGHWRRCDNGVKRSGMKRRSPDVSSA